MANSFAPITKYLTKAIDTVFASESKTNDLLNGGKFINLNFDETGYVKIMEILMDGLSDYYRVNEGSSADAYSHWQNGSADGYKVGTTETSWEIFKLSYDRGRQFQIDNISNEEEAGMVIGNLLTEFLRTKVVPEVDAIRFSKIAGKTAASLGNRVEETPTASDILAKFFAGFEWLTEHEVPEEEQVIYVNPTIMSLIRNSDKLVKYITQDEYKNGDVDFKINKFAGRTLIEVPSNRFMTDVVVGDNGYYAGSTSKVINYMIVSKKAIVPIVKLEKSKVWTPEQVQDFDGYKVNFRMFHDVIIPKNKVIGCYASISAVSASTKNSLLNVLIEEGSVANAYKVSATYTTPAGIKGTLVVSQTSANVGDAIEIGTTYESVDLGVDVVDADHDDAYFYLVDAFGKVVAKTNGKVELEKHD